MNRKSFFLNWVEREKSFIISGPGVIVVQPYHLKAK